MVLYTCLNCQVAFADADIQREHYKSDWHRYNLKRRVSELPPVTAEEFSRRVQIVLSENEEKRQGRNYVYCSVCKKSFSSEKSFQNHLRSRKHGELCRAKSLNDECRVAQTSIKNFNMTSPVEKEASPDENENSFEFVSSDSELVDSDEWEEIISDSNPILQNDCLFCAHHSASLTRNVKHMSVAHSFFIPYVEYLTDMKGLLLYLGEKICQGHMCIWCNDKRNTFPSIEAVRNHMIDKGHAKIRSDTEASLEYLDFFDFGSAYGYEKEDDDNIHSLSAIKEDVINTDDTSHADPITMLLPSGDVICHRSLIKYFRQNPPLTKNRVSSTTKSNVQKLINYYRALGWNPTQRELVKKKVNDIRYINYVRSKYETKLKLKTNKLQKHYRHQVDF